MFEKLYRPIVLILLVVIAISLVATIFVQNSYIKKVTTVSPECQAAIISAKDISSRQMSVITSMMDGYNKAVYSNPQVDNINKQILMANEYEFTSLWMIAMQNSALLSVYANCQ